MIAETRWTRGDGTTDHRPCMKSRNCDYCNRFSVYVNDFNKNAVGAAMAGDAPGNCNDREEAG